MAVEERPGVVEAGEKRAFFQRMLDGIEKVGNKVPHPAMIFLGLCVLVIVLSSILAAFDISVTYDVVEQPPVIAEGRSSAVPMLPTSLSRPTTTSRRSSRSSRRPPRSRAS
ncbi:MAG: AbgT family transporter [Acidimicrobiales bacterium]